MPRKKRHKTTCKLPEADILQRPTAPEEYQFTADMYDMLGKIKRIRRARGGRPFFTPPSITSTKYTALPDGLYQHLLRLILWTAAMSTPGTIPKWATNHPAIRAKELAAHNLIYTTKDGHLLLTCYIGTTEADCKHINDPHTTQVYSPSAYTYIGTGATP